MSYEKVFIDGTLFAEIIWSDTRVDTTKFYSDASSSFQFGLLAHGAGFVEPAHNHQPINREINDLQQMFFVQFGVIEVSFYSDSGEILRSIILKQGDAINLVHGVHSIKVIEAMQCVSVKQGPFLGDQLDKVNVTTK